MRRERVRFIEDGLLPEHVGKTRNASRPDHCAGYGSAAIGKRSNWLLHVLEVRIPAECPITAFECAIDPHVELILKVGIVGRSRVVVSGCRQIGGGRKARQQCLCRRIERRIDDVLSKLLTHIFSTPTVVVEGSKIFDTPVKMPCLSFSVGMVEMRVTPINCLTPW